MHYNISILLIFIFSLQSVAGFAQDSDFQQIEQNILPDDFVGEIKYSGQYKAYALSSADIERQSRLRNSNSPYYDRRLLGVENRGDFIITINYRGRYISGAIETRAHRARSDGWSWPKTFSGTRAGDVCTIPKLVPNSNPITTKCDKKQFSYEAVKYPSGNGYTLSSFVTAKAPEAKNFIPPDPVGRIASLITVYDGRKEIYEGRWISTGADPRRRSIQFYGICGIDANSCQNDVDKKMLGFAFYDTLTDSYTSGFYLTDRKMRFCSEKPKNCIDYNLILRPGAVPWTRKSLNSMSYEAMYDAVAGALNRVNRVPAHQSNLTKCLRFKFESKDYITPYFDKQGFKVRDEFSKETSHEIANICSEPIIVDVDDCLLLGNEFPVKMDPGSSRMLLPMSGSCNFYQLSRKWPE